MRRKRLAMAAGLVMLAACTAAVSYAPPDVASPSAAAERIDWNQAIALLRSGRVLAVVQLHDLTVTLTTDDGKRHATREPMIDAILDAITLNAPNAQAIVIATE
ncbi:MAG: hypothetical protein ABL964_00265 [Steroidobacteraceae bacterium]